MQQHEYFARVYAGLLGKMAGVYLGRPVEGWTYERIAVTIGPIGGYINERLGLPLVVTDDDLSGSLAFLRALPEQGFPADLTPQHVAAAWLNNIVPGRSILWWGGRGNSTEHTAFLRLLEGVPAPMSGSAALNGPIVAEQIGAQIFIDGWAMLCPGDPASAARLAAAAARVSHDGEAVYAAQLIAAMEAAAFVESEIGQLLAIGLEQIPPTSTIARLARALLALREREPDWRAARAWLALNYGYDRYPGNCHVVPNHGVVLLALLWGAGDMARSLAIAVEAGWDTDCNAGNVGCLLGIRGGLAAIPAALRDPMNDRLYIPSADGGRAVTDALREALWVTNLGLRRRSEPELRPGAGARFHFSLPGSTQGFSPAAGLSLANPDGAGLLLRWAEAVPSALRALTPTFIPPADLAMPGYELLASPALYPGQTLRARVVAPAANSGPVACRLTADLYRADDSLAALEGPEQSLEPGQAAELEWRLPDSGGAPVAGVGLALMSAEAGELRLERLGWAGEPEGRLTPRGPGGLAWRRAWVDAADHYSRKGDGTLQIVQNTGRGLLIQGAQDWADYRFTATLSSPMAGAIGLAVRVAGLRRYLALLLTARGLARLVLVWDDEERDLAVAELPWQVGRERRLALEARGGEARAWVGDELLFAVAETGAPAGGAAALVVEAGCLEAREPQLAPSHG